MNAPVNADHELLARSLPLDRLDVSDPALYRDDVWMPYFRRLRREDPVHWTAESMFGPHWSITRYNDIMQAELAHKSCPRNPRSAASPSATGGRTCACPCS